MFSLTSATSHRTVNTAQFGYLHQWFGFNPIGINPEANIFESGQLVLTIGRDRGSPQQDPVRQFQWSDTVYHNQGSHALKLGATSSLIGSGSLLGKTFPVVTISFPHSELRLLSPVLFALKNGHRGSERYPYYLPFRRASPKSSSCSICRSRSSPIRPQLRSWIAVCRSTRSSSRDNSRYRE
jgi:hypothetical protein